MSETAMNWLSSYERALLEQLVAEKERRRRIENESRPQLPLYDEAIPPAQDPDPGVERPAGRRATGS
jgi:hypothetical protein